MTPFQSNDEFFRAVEDLMAKLDAAGHKQAADELREGYRCLNGLTDGAVLFLESIEKVRKIHTARFSEDDRKALEAIRSSADKAVHRR